MGSLGRLCTVAENKHPAVRGPGRARPTVGTWFAPYARSCFKYGSGPEVGVVWGRIAVRSQAVQPKSAPKRPRKPVVNGTTADKMRPPEHSRPFAFPDPGRNWT
jgi:hypothetical protein